MALAELAEFCTGKGHSQWLVSWVPSRFLGNHATSFRGAPLNRAALAASYDGIPTTRLKEKELLLGY